MGSKMFPHVFQPIRIRGIDFKNRIVLAPPSPNLAGTNGEVTPQLVNWMRMFARGGVCTLYLGNSSIDITESKDEAFQLNLRAEPGDTVKFDSIVLNLARYADMCKEYDCHASLEINHNGENTHFETVGHAPYSASSFISAGERAWAAAHGRDPIPSIEMTKEKIDETVNKFGDAAAMMKRAGMDICLVHGGHGNLISQFTSPLYNHRTDEYGGSLENRARFAIEVCDNIRQKCGEDFVIEFRISADEIAEEGMHFDETLELIGMLKDHIDIIHVSAGLHSDFQMKYMRNWCQNFMMERGFNVHYAAKVKERYPDLLVTTVGSIQNLELAEEILANGWADFVAMCRGLMADPDMPNKYSHDMPEEHRPCLRCDKCMGHLFVPKPIWCAINPISAMTDLLKDGEVPKAKVKKKCAVVGGGPGGVQALMTLCERGHDVTLYEKTGQIGGNVIDAAIPDFKVDMKDYCKWLQYQADKYAKEYGAKILLNTKATKEMLDAENYDAVIIAIGADPVIPKSIPGIDKDIVAYAPDAEAGRVPCEGNNIVVIGAGSIGMEAAVDYALQGRHVEVVEMMSYEEAFWKLRGSAGNSAREMYENIIPEKDVVLHNRTKLVEVKDHSVVCENMDTGEQFEINCDKVLLGMGQVAKTAEADEFRHCAPEHDVHLIGDCVKAATISEAVNGAFQKCLHI
ncbi:MAG: FAD-dependent oxidoreductase [Lachnospiraceae bacterium]|nr:FAD-dependent oxidoreductase [Lachnospiraceae bacterium]